MGGLSGNLERIHYERHSSQCIFYYSVMEIIVPIVIAVSPQIPPASKAYGISI